MENRFIDTFSYKLIYIFSINASTHQGYLKIGEATIHSVKDISLLPNSCKQLNKAAKDRINSYTATAGISYDLLHTELAVYSHNDKTIGFRDHNVHDVLKASGIKRKFFDTERKQNEWYEVDLQTAKAAITAVKQRRKSLNSSEISEGQTPISFRPEQKKAIEQAVSQFKKNNRMLWNAKMRFGKTLSALEVAKRMESKRTIILTHRPVVGNSWFEDFYKIFYDRDDYTFGAKSLGHSLSDLEQSNKNYVYFASIQDLRGSNLIGGKYDKNIDVFQTIWDYVIIDEAHEGTKTDLGNDIRLLVVGRNTKLLELSGTPFNLLEDYKENEIYTWDYVMEQSAKQNWIKNNYCDSNPYETLPRLNIFTYDINKLITGYEDFEDKAFNFREFFRTWTGDLIRDKKHVPDGVSIGDFVHEEDIISFLNLITRTDDKSNYPFATEEYRSFFRHSLWMVPGVKEAKALSALLKSHPVFGSGAFNIANVAGDGDEEKSNNDAMKLVEAAIGENPDENYSITISCGRLTTGVSVKAWTAVLMLSGSYSTRASTYMQTIFRVQTPATINGRMKEQCYVFDFAPDRTLKILAETSKVSTKGGKTTGGDRDVIGEFLNFCPVISIDGTKMEAYNVDSMLQQLKQIYTDKVVNSGFDDINIYNDKLLQLNNLELLAFDDLKKIIGTSKQTKKQNEVDVNSQGLTGEEYEQLRKAEKKPKRQLTDEEKELIERAKKKSLQKQTAISILRGISIRIPLLVYGADVAEDEDITVENFTSKIDALSWAEFMPDGVTKQKFNEFAKYFDPDIFVAAGRKIRTQTKNADALPPTERVLRIIEILSTFKNPDKETVLTPWRVVNMHLGDCLGGYVFYDENYNKDILLEEPRFVDHGDVTADTLSNTSARILEINSKTGLYPLYVVYSIFRKRCEEYDATKFNEEVERELWLKTVAENIFIICKTPMAKQITKRTLLGYKQSKINTRHFEDLINQIKNKPDNFIKTVRNGQKYCSTNTEKDMKFNAVVGNPPYQVMDGGAKASAKPIYNHFVDIARKLNPNFASMIIPTRWYAGGKGLDEFRDSMLGDTRMRELYDYLNPADLFPNTNIRGGICYFLWNDNYNNSIDLTKVVTCQSNGVRFETKRLLKSNDSDTFIRHGMAISIVDKVNNFSGFNSLSPYVSVLRPFGFRGYFTNDERFRPTSEGLKRGIICYGKTKQIGYVEYDEITIKREWINKFKVYTPRANNIGTELNDDNLNTFIGEPNTICTESYIVLGADLNLNASSAHNLSMYCRSRFVRFMHSLSKASQDATAKTYKFVPLQDFTEDSDIDWNKSVEEIDQQLYAKYKLNEEEIAFIEQTIKPM